MDAVDQIRRAMACSPFEHFGLRAHRRNIAVGETLPNSKIWRDGNMTADELPGCSTIKITPGGDIAAALEKVRQIYGWGGASVILVGGWQGSYGEDPEEIIIENGECLAVLRGPQDAADGIRDMEPDERQAGRLNQ
jgi:hypothetical protein